MNISLSPALPCLHAGMALLSHLRAMLTDPGAVPKDAAPLPDDEDQEAGELDLDTGSFNSSHRRRKQVHSMSTRTPPAL